MALGLGLEQNPVKLMLHMRETAAALLLQPLHDHYDVDVEALTSLTIPSAVISALCLRYFHFKKIIIIFGTCLTRNQRKLVNVAIFNPVNSTTLTDPPVVLALLGGEFSLLTVRKEELDNILENMNPIHLSHLKRLPDAPLLGKEKQVLGCLRQPE